MSSPRPTRPISGKAFLIGVVGVLAAVVLLLVGLFILTGPSEPSGREVATSMCSAVAADPAGDRYSMATQHYPPDRDLGRVGTAASYRQAARAIDGFCPQYVQQAELLRSMARIYDPSGG